MTVKFIGPEEVEARLTYEVCIPLMRDAMAKLSTGGTKQLLRQIIDLNQGNAFGVMPGALVGGAFGAKLISVFPGNVSRGGLSHQGLIMMFDADSGAPTAVVDAGTVTGIRTASASAAATDALARPDATRLAILGTGEQARRHCEAIRCIRPIAHVAIWGRDVGKAEALAVALGATAVASVEAAVDGADIICTATAARDPILFSHQVADGTHINAVGSSRAGPSEIDEALVARSLFVADHREGVLAQGDEFLRAKAAGLVTDDHVVAEIGELFAGLHPGRTDSTQVTIYKSLGSIVQDLASAAWLIAD